MALRLKQYLKMSSFSGSIKILLTVNGNCVQHSLRHWNCRDGYYADVAGREIELL